MHRHRLCPCRAWDQYVRGPLSCPPSHRLVGRAVRCPPPQRADLGSILAFYVDLFPGRVIPVTSTLAALPGAWRYRVSAGAGWPGVSIL